MTDDTGPAGDEASLHVAASPQRCYELVSDITKMGRLSPECTGGRWLGRTKAPVVGARFLGTNRRGRVWWATISRVVAADPGREFAFETGGSATRWRYRFAPDGDGTMVTESREASAERPASAKVFARYLLGGVDAHEQEMRDGMLATLGRLKTLAETG